MDPEIKVEFHLNGTKITPDKITNLLEISPTRTYKLGEPIQGTKLRNKNNGWCVSIDVPKDSLDVLDYLTPLVNYLFPYKERITKICDEYELDCEIGCTIFIVEQTPSLTLNPDIISKLAELKTYLDIDIILTE